MPNITLADLGVNRLFTDVSIAYVAEQDQFIHDKVFPIVPAGAEDGFYFEFSREDMLRVATQERRPGTRTMEKTMGLTKREIGLKQYSLAMTVPDEYRESVDSPLATAEPIIKAITQDMLMHRELNWISTYLNVASTPWANTNVSPSTAWGSSGATPIADIKSWIRTVQLACGRKPNKLVLDPLSWDVLSEDAGVLARLADSDIKDISKEFVAGLCGLSEILVPEAVYNSAAEAATYSGARALGSGIGGLFYTTSAPAKMEPSAGYTFSWSQFDEVRADISRTGAAAMQTYRDEDIEADKIRGKAHYQHKVVTPSAGVIIASILG